MIQSGQVVMIEGRNLSPRAALVLDVRQVEGVATPVISVVYVDTMKELLTENVTAQPVVRHAVVYKYEAPPEPTPWRWWEGDPKSLGGL